MCIVDVILCYVYTFKFIYPCVFHKCYNLPMLQAQEEEDSYSDRVVMVDQAGLTKVGLVDNILSDKDHVLM